MSQDITPFDFSEDEREFDETRRFDEDGEFWSAREIQELYGYNNWQDFNNAIDRAMTACKNSGQNAQINFRETPKNKTGDNRGRTGTDYRLTRYACYLVAMNGDPKKREIARAQTYFAVKTREAEIAQATRNNTLDYLYLQEARLRLITAAKDIVLDRQWLDNLAREELTKGLQRELGPAPEDRSLGVELYLEQKGINASTRRSKSGSFGKRLKKLYTLTYGDEPDKAMRFYNGQHISVSSYTEKDRPLFDEVFEIMFDNAED